MILVHHRANPSSMSLVPILYTCVERDNVEQSFLSKERTRWKGPGVEPAAFRFEVQHTFPPYSNMAENTLFFCLHVNWPLLPHFKPNIPLNSADGIKAKRANQQ